MSHLESSTSRCCRISSAESRKSVRLVYPLLLVLMCQLHCSFGGHYNDNMDAATSTFNCSKHWCGETWWVTYFLVLKSGCYEVAKAHQLLCWKSLFKIIYFVLGDLTKFWDTTIRMWMNWCLEKPSIKLYMTVLEDMTQVRNGKKEENDN